MKTVEIVEVSPRDGFQSVKPFIPTERKIALIEELAACGFRRMEIGSFVSPKAIPQMADTPEILQRAHLPKDMRRYGAGSERQGPAAGQECRRETRSPGWSRCRKATTAPTSIAASMKASRNFEAAWSGLGQDKPKLRLGLSTCFDCPWEGRVPEEAVIRAVERVLEIAPDVEIGICDTTGRAAPDHVGQSVRHACCRAMPATASSSPTTATTPTASASPTPSKPIARACGIFDGAAGGLGGCPFAPGAAGNTASEDLVFAFEHMGVKTGIDLSKLLTAADHVAGVEPGQAGGKLRTVPRRRALSGFGHATQGLGA